MHIRSLKEYANCSIVETKGKYFTQPYAWAFPKYSPYLEIFDFYISQVIEKGQWDAIENRYKANPQVCLDMSGMPIEFANCFTAFLAWISGLFLGLLLLLFENLFKPLKQSFRRPDWIKTTKVETELMDKDQLQLTIIRQRKIINHMKSVIQMNQKRLKTQQLSKGTQSP